MPISTLNICHPKDPQRHTQEASQKFYPPSPHKIFQKCKSLQDSYKEKYTSFKCSSKKKMASFLPMSLSWNQVNTIQILLA